MPDTATATKAAPATILHDYDDKRDTPRRRKSLRSAAIFVAGPDRRTDSEMHGGLGGHSNPATVAAAGRNPVGKRDGDEEVREIRHTAYWPDRRESDRPAERRIRSECDMAIDRK